MGLIRRAEASSLLFSKCPEEKSYAQNTDKLIGVVSLNGGGAHQGLRAIQNGHIRASHTLTDYNKSLGSMVANDGSFRFERSARAEAVHTAKFNLEPEIRIGPKGFPTSCVGCS